MKRVMQYVSNALGWRTEESVAGKVDEVNQRHRELGHDLKDLRARTDALYRLVLAMRRPPDV